MSVDYDQVARYEAAIELLNSVRAVFSIFSDDEKYGKECGIRRKELMIEKQELDPKDDDRVAKIRKTYAPLSKEFYGNEETFVMSDKYLSVRS